MTEAERRTARTISNAEDALTAVLSLAGELRGRVNFLIHTYGMDSPEEVPGQVIPTLTRLSDHVDTLTAEIARLADEQEQQRVRLGALGKRGVFLSIVVGAAVVLLAGFVFLYFGQVTTRGQLDRLVAEQDRQAAEVACPFYALILGSYRPETRPEGPDRELYESQFQIMRDIYARIPCTDPLVPPAGG